MSAYCCRIFQNKFFRQNFANFLKAKLCEIQVGFRQTSKFRGHVSLCPCLSSCPCFYSCSFSCSCFCSCQYPTPAHVPVRDYVRDSVRISVSVQSMSVTLSMSLTVSVLVLASVFRSAYSQKPFSAARKRWGSYRPIFGISGQILFLFLDVGTIGIMIFCPSLLSLKIKR